MSEPGDRAIDMMLQELQPQQQRPSGQAQQIAAQGLGLSGPMRVLPEPPLDNRELDALALLVRSDVLTIVGALQAAYRLGKSRGSRPDIGKVAR
jgi:hypothetical protein